MTDPATIFTATAIATLAFQKFFGFVAAELAQKFSSESIAKMDTLLKRIGAKLQSKPQVEKVKSIIKQTHNITPEQFDQIAAYLQVAMDEDPQFASDVQMLAQEINAGKLIAGKLIDQSNTVAENYRDVEVSVLLTNLGYCYPHGRQSAAEVPGKMGGEISIPALMNALNNDQDSDVREKAVEALGEISSKTAISALLEALEDKDPQVRLAVSEAIASIDSKVTALSLPNQQEE